MPKSKCDQGGSPERGRARVQEIASSLNRKYGVHTALPLNIAAVAEVLRLPFGILSLDWKTRGGLVVGRFNRLWGKKSTLKTTACLRAVGQAQKHCRHCKTPIVEDPTTGKKNCRCPDPRYELKDSAQFPYLDHDQSIQIRYGMLPKGVTKTTPSITVSIEKMKEIGAMIAKGDAQRKKVEVKFVEVDRNEPFRCIYIDSEHTIDEKWARRNGVDTSLVQLVGGKWAEQVLDTTEDLILTREFDLIVIDSLAMLTPEDTVVKSHRENLKMGEQAALMTRACKKWLAAMAEEGLMNRYAPTILATDQVRVKGLGTPFSRVAPAAANAVDHNLSLDVQMKLGERGYEFKGDVAQYGNFAFKVTKNKAGGSPKVEGAFRFWLKPTSGRPVGDVEDQKVVVEQARGLGLVESAKNHTLHSEYIENGSEMFKTLTALNAFLEIHPTVYLDLRSRVLAALIQKDETGTVEIKLGDQKEPAPEVEEEESEQPVRRGKKKGVGKKTDPFTQKFS